jgi:hypothetical protein
MLHTPWFRRLACLILLLGAAAPGLAQNAPLPLPTADLAVDFEDDGTANLYLTLPARPADPAAVEEAVRQVFARPFQHLQGQMIGGAWNLSGRCEGALSPHGLTRAGELRLAPLAAALRPLGVVYLSTYVACPPVPFSRCARADAVRWENVQSTGDTFGLPAAEGPRPIEVEFGYPPADLLRLVPLVLLLLVPPALTLWWARAAVRAGAADPTGSGASQAAVFLLVRDVVPTWGYRDLRRGLAARLRARGLDPGAAVFVGYAPSALPRIYEGTFDWDVGFLFVEAGHLSHVGDQARFCLRRAQITGVRVAWRVPSWLPARRVYVAWHDPASGAGGTFCLRAAAAGSLRGVDRRSRALGERLQAWWQQPATAAPPAAPDFPAPEVAPAVGLPPHAVISLFASLYYLGMVLLTAGGLAVISGLPVDPRQGSETLYALFVATVLVVVNLLPFWLYRDPKAAGGRE